jgi:hypothetical protein
MIVPFYEFNYSYSIPDPPDLEDLDHQIFRLNLIDTPDIHGLTTFVLTTKTLSSR